MKYLGLLQKKLSIASYNKTTFIGLFSFFLKNYKMADVLVNYSIDTYTDAEFVIEVESIETKMAASVSTYVTPSPTLAVITAQRIKFQGKVALAHNGTPTQTSDKDDERKILEGMIHVECAYVQLTSGGDETKILSSGMHTAASKALIGALGVVSGFNVLTQQASNKVLVSCKAMPKARFYEILFTPSPATDASVWVTKTTTSHSLEIDGLPSFVPYVFKMAACGTDQGRNFSVPITRAAN